MAHKDGKSFNDFTKNEKINSIKAQIMNLEAAIRKCSKEYENPQEAINMFKKNIRAMEERL